MVFGVRTGWRGRWKRGEEIKKRNAVNEMWNWTIEIWKGSREGCAQCWMMNKYDCWSIARLVIIQYTYVAIRFLKSRARAPQQWQQSRRNYIYLFRGSNRYWISMKLRLLSRRSRQLHLRSRSILFSTQLFYRNNDNAIIFVQRSISALKSQDNK